VRHHGGEDDHPDPAGEDGPPEQRQHREQDEQHADLADLDADVERQERDEQVGPRELEVLLQPIGEAEAVHQAEEPGDQPPPP